MTRVDASAKIAALVDTTRCMGCRACQVACKQWNQLPSEKTRFRGTYENPPSLSAVTWTKIQFFESSNGKQEWRFRKQQCFHCDKASCVTVCPTGAAKELPNGIVIIDQSLCTGCKYCVEACPFQTPKFSEKTGTAIKCRFCWDRVSNGLGPACVKACPTGALFFGRREDVLREAKARAEKVKGAKIYGENELGGLGWIYLVDVEDLAQIGMIKDPKPATKGIFGKWLAGVIPGVAILTGLGWLFKRRKAVAGPAAEKKT